MTKPTAWPVFQPAEATNPTGTRTYKYYDLLMVAFVTVLICSEFIAAGKVARTSAHSSLEPALFSSRFLIYSAISLRRSTAMPARAR